MPLFSQPLHQRTPGLGSEASSFLSCSRVLNARRETAPIAVAPFHRRFTSWFQVLYASYILSGFNHLKWRFCNVIRETAAVLLQLQQRAPQIIPLGASFPTTRPVSGDSLSLEKNNLGLGKGIDL